MLAQHAVTRRRHWRARRYPAVAAIVPASVMIAIEEDIAIDAARVHDYLLIYNRYSVLVHVMDVGDAHVVDPVVVVGDVRDVRNARVVDVDRAEVVAAHAIRRNVRFAVAQREPADAGAAAGPYHKRRRIPWTHADWSGNPAPRSAYNRPAAVVEGSEAPGGIINPGPAPRLNPCPVAVPIGLPSDRYPGWKPYRAVDRDLSPSTIFVEVFVSDHVRGDVAGGNGAITPLLAPHAPLVEGIESRRIESLVGQRPAACEPGLTV